MINKIYVYKSHTKKSIGRTPAINPFSTNTERKNRDKSVSHLITTTDLIQWSQRLIRAVIEHFLIYFNGKYADFAGTDDVTIPYISHSLFTRHQILWSGERTYHTNFFFYLIAYFTKVKGTELSWPFLDYFDFLKTECSVQSLNKIVKFWNYLYDFFITKWWLIAK